MANRYILTLTALRKRIDLSQEDLAIAVNQTQPDISTYENGTSIPLHRAEALLEALRAADREKRIPKWVVPRDLSINWEDVILAKAPIAS